MKKTATMRAVNRLYLLALLLVFLISAFARLPAGWSPVVNELALLGLLGLYLGRSGLSLRSALKLKRISFRTALLSLVAGMELFPFSRWLASSLMERAGFTPPLAPEYVLVTGPALLGLVIGAGLLAPVVEELFFRGLLQRAYQRRGPVIGIIASALLFAFFHLDIFQGTAVIGLGLAAAYLSWRYSSVLPAILLHIGHNALSVGLSTAEFFIDGFAMPEAAPEPALAGGMICLLLVWALGRGALSQPHSLAPEPGRVFGWAWPLLPAAALFALVVGSTLVAGITPEKLALGLPLELDSTPWTAPAGWRYGLFDDSETQVGAAFCTVVPEANIVHLSCEIERQAVDGAADARASQQTDVRWHSQSLHLLNGKMTLSAGEHLTRTVLRPGRQGLEMRVEIDGLAAGEVQLEGDALLAAGDATSGYLGGTWPWRLAGLPFAPAFSRTALVALPLVLPSEGQDLGPRVENGFAVVETAKTVTTPAGQFVGWQVRVGDEVAWFDVEVPHVPLAYRSGALTWKLLTKGAGYDE